MNECRTFFLSFELVYSKKKHRLPMKPFVKPPPGRTFWGAAEPSSCGGVGATSPHIGFSLPTQISEEPDFFNERSVPAATAVRASYNE
jgi:hypothetical protein